MENSESQTSENKLSTDSLGAARMDFNTKYKDELRKEYKEIKSVRPDSHSTDSEVNWGRSEDLHQKKSSYPPRDVGVCGEETITKHSHSQTQATEKSQAKDVMAKSVPKRSSHVKMKASGKSPAKVI